VDEAVQALGDQFVGGTRPVGAPFGVEADDLVEPGADADQLRRQLVEIDEGLVPSEKVQLPVEHGDALTCVVEGVLQEIAAVLDGRRCVVEKF
jgi:hypothetical protein